MPTLYIFSGLPGTGKTTLSQALAKQISAVYLRIDTIEQEIRDLCAIEIQGEGYELAYRIAADNLQLGISVVADSCNPVELTRSAWEKVALEADAKYINIEIVCSDRSEHRDRIETRASSIPGLRLPTWQDVENRDFQPWSGNRIVIDTSGQSEKESCDRLLSALSNM
ncbi:MAG: AAA family ATPase [Oscillatoriales cyanobacterium RU_3_3]|nr:AAA family ATPase [Oscillatoriales cyanobacterium RU_3_3]NJR25845.1 AAA family ATPase [Richelia sp. CSU_2_1]